MSEVFNPLQGPILISIEVHGPSGPVKCVVAVDTGATTTLLKATLLAGLGYNLATAQRQHQMVTASGTVLVPEIVLTRVVALGQTRTNFPVMAHNLPASAGIDGVLGLDFMRGHELKINFRLGLIDLL